MSLYEQWQNLIDNQTDETFPDFWEKYSSTETKIYTDILENHEKTLTGTFQELVSKYEADPVIFNMLGAEADYLYSISAWDKVLSTEKREEIIKEFKKSKTVVKEKEPGRNDPCPCGSGKKYKKCCGK